MRFRDRAEAGKLLAQVLTRYADDNAVIYALPRGGVVLGAEVATALHAPLDLVITRKVGHPHNPEYAVCAVSESGQLLCTEEERLLLDEHWLAGAIEREREEAARRRARYLGDRPVVPATGKIAILVDDGIATGLTMRVAIREIRRQHPALVVVAVPIIPRETADMLAREADEVVALDIPAVFLGAVGAYYEDFRPVEDAEVIRLLQEDPTLLFCLPLCQVLGDALLKLLPLAPGRWTAARFPNGELHLSTATPIAGNPCIVLGSLTPPDAHLLETFLLCHTVRKEGARHVTALLPYLAYMRQEKNEAARSRATAWVGAAAQASGINRIVTVDIHSPEAERIMPISVVSLSPAPLYVAALRGLMLDDITLVAPDEGAIPRCEAVRAALGIPRPVAYLRKVRYPEGVRSTLHGDVGTRAVVVDDILDTGGTLIACGEALREVGVASIIVMVTHGLFTGMAWQRLWELGVTRIYCTDSVPLPPQIDRTHLQVLSLAPLLAQFLAEESQGA